MSPAVRNAVAALTIAAAAALLAGCASGDAGEPVVPTTAPVATSAPSSQAGTLPTAVPSADPNLPENWPVAIPGLPGGRLLSAVVSEDGRAVNGTWATDAPPAEVWAEMDARLRSLGYVTSAESGGENLLVEDESQRSDYFVRDGYEVNLVVIAGDQTTVLVNGSAL